MDGSMALQEVPLAYVDKDDAALIVLKSKFHQTPPYTPPQRVENLAGGTIVRKASFVSFRAIGKQVFLWEHTVDKNTASGAAAPSPQSTSLAIQLPESVARNGVGVFESADKQYLSVCVVTAAKTVHRFCYKLDPTLDFADAARDEVAFAMTSLSFQTSVSSVCWLDECNVVVGGDNGAVLAINVGLSIFGHSASSFHEVPLTDHSVLNWVWQGLGLQPSQKPQPVVAIAAVPDLDDASSTDTLVVTLSADLVLRVWSYEHQSCLCNQSLRSLLELDAAHQATLHFIPSSSDIRLLVHVTSLQPSKTKEIVLLRGTLTSKALDLDVVRRYVVDVPAAVRLVDFVVTAPATQLVSVWRSATEDFVYVFPIALTGPRVILGQRVGGMDTFVHHHEMQDNQLSDTTDLVDIDNFYLERLFAPARFTADCIRQALGGSHAASSSAALSDAALQRLVLDAVHRETSVQLSKARHHDKEDVVRSSVWTQLLQKCTKLWAVENTPLGVATCSIAGSIVLLRRNHTSIFFPSTRAIVASSSTAAPSSISQHDELAALVTSFFESFSYSDVHAAVVREWNVDVHVDLTSPSLLDTLRRALQQGLLHPRNQTNGHGSSLPKLLARVAPILAGDAAAQTAVLTAMVDHLALFESATFNAATNDGSTSNTASSALSVDLGLALHRMGTVVVNDMLTATFSALCFLVFLDDAQPSFVSPAALQHIAASLVPRGLALLRTWVFYQWLFGQAMAGSQAMLVQDFAKAGDDDLSPPTNLATAVVSLLEKVHDLPALASYVHSIHHHDVLRVVVRYALQRPKKNTDASTVKYLTHLLGDALVAQAAAANEHNDAAGVTHVLARAVRSYLTVLDLEAQLSRHPPTPDAPLATQLYDITTHLKETVPRPYAAKFILQFLRAALVYVGADSAAAEFVWYNVFKLALTEHLFDEAHVALQHVVRGADASTVDDCVRHFVLQLCDAGRLDVVVGLSWGALEGKVEDVLQWQAANTHAGLSIKRVSQSAVSVLRLLYSFFVKRGRFAAAANAMHALFVRLEPDAFSVDVLRAQRDALFSAANVLALVPEPHRWFVTQQDSDAKTTGLHVVTIADLRRDLLVVRGKLFLSDSVPTVTLAGQSGTEVVSLLLKHLTPDSMAKSVALAVEIARVHDLDVNVVVRAVARDLAFSSGSEVHLQTLLRHVNSSEAYLAAIGTLLHLHAPLPPWLTDATVATGSLTVVALLRLYLDHGVLDEAVALAIDHLIPTNVSKAAFQVAAASDTSPKWMPYQLLDNLVAACDAVISTSGNDVAALRSSSSRLKQRVAEYLQYVRTADAAASIRRQHDVPRPALSNPFAGTTPSWSTN